MKPFIWLALLGCVGVLLSQSAHKAKPDNLAAVSDNNDKSGCPPDTNLLYQGVVRAMWAKDEGEHPFAEANGFIRIAVHPAWENEYFFDVRLKKTGVPAITAYTLPKATKTVTTLIGTELKRTPCAAAIADAIPIRRRSIAVTKDIQHLLDEFFTIRLAPRRMPDEIRFDATEYEVEFRGDDTILFNSTSSNAAMVKWVRSFAAAAGGVDTEQHN